MKTAHDLVIQEKCQSCNLRGKGFFCELPDGDLPLFEAVKITRSFSRGSMLFVEGQPSNGVYMLCQGKVKLSTGSSDGKVIILEVAAAGDVLGLSSALNGIDHETSAEAVEWCQVNYVTTADLIRFMQSNTAASLNAARQMSRNYQTAYRQICSIGMSDSVVDRLAKLFLGWTGTRTGSNLHLESLYTHEEMAEMIGVSRETVTRALRYLREHDLVTVKGADMLIHSTSRLKALVGSHGIAQTGL